MQEIAPDTLQISATLRQPNKTVGIIGTGWVGTSVAMAILQTGAASELWLHDARGQVADEVYRRRSEAPSRVLDILNQGYSEEETQRRLALWRAQPVRFWFVWVQPFGLNDPA